MEKENTEELMRKLCATAAKALQEVRSLGGSYSDDRDYEFYREQFIHLAKHASPMGKKELEYVASFN